MIDYLQYFDKLRQVEREYMAGFGTRITHIR